MERAGSGRLWKIIARRQVRRVSRASLSRSRRAEGQTARISRRAMARPPPRERTDASVAVIAAQRTEEARDVVAPPGGDEPDRPSKLDLVSERLVQIALQ